MIRNTLWVILGLVVVVAAVFLGWEWFAHPRPLGPDELLRLALDRNAPGGQEKAAAKLAALAGQAHGCGDKNHLQPYLLRVLDESGSPGARAASIRGLATILDYSVPYPDLLDDESVQVRTAAGMAVQRLMSRKFPFRPNDPPQKRKAMTAQIRQEWVKDANWREESYKRQVEEDRALAKHGT